MVYIQKLTKAQNRSLIALRKKLQDSFSYLTNPATKGNSAKSIAWINRTTVKQDIEIILARPLTKEEGESLLLAPEHIEDKELRLATSLAKSLQAVRTMTRRYLRDAHVSGRLHERESIIFSDCFREANKILDESEPFFG